MPARGFLGVSWGFQGFPPERSEDVLVSYYGEREESLISENRKCRGIWKIYNIRRGNESVAQGHTLSSAGKPVGKEAALRARIQRRAFLGQAARVLPADNRSSRILPGGRCSYRAADAPDRGSSRRTHRPVMLLVQDRRASLALQREPAPQARRQCPRTP